MGEVRQPLRLDIKVNRDGASGGLESRGSGFLGVLY
jgi:hypothetical protein